MLVLPVIKYGHPVLRQPAEEYKYGIEINQNLVDNMIETMQKQDGVGLAAPQLGVSTRLVVAGYGQEFHVVANPKIVERSNEIEIDVEGCLSLPGLQGNVKRYQDIIIRGMDRNGESIEIKATGLMARVFQHEIDHLNGTLYIDRVELNTLCWVIWNSVERKKELEVATIKEIQDVYRENYNQNQKYLKF